MSDEASATPPVPEEGSSASGAVLVGVVAGQSPRVVKEAARYAKAFAAPLLVVNVDVTRFVAYEDPDGSVQTAAIDLAAIGREGEVRQVTDETTAALNGYGVEWSLRWLVGDPALAMKKLAEEVGARLIVVGTRKQGIGESIREFFTGSVAVRLAHRQARPVLVVPIGQLLEDDQDFAD